MAIREHCYKILVRPQLECTSSVWDNPVKHIVGKVEAIQRSVARFTCHDFKCTPSVTTMLQKLCWIHFNNVELIAESLCCTTFAMVWWPFLLQLTFNQLQPTPTGPKPDTDRSSAIQTHTAIPSFLLQFVCGILYRSMVANYRQKLQSSTELSPADVNAYRPCFYPLHCTVFICSSLLPFAPLLPLHTPGPSPWCDITQPELAPIWKKKSLIPSELVFICSSLLPFVTVCTNASASCTWTLSPWCDINQPSWHLSGRRRRQVKCGCADLQMIDYKVRGNSVSSRVGLRLGLVSEYPHQHLHFTATVI